MVSFKTVLAVSHHFHSNQEAPNSQVLLCDLHLVLHGVCLVSLLVVSPLSAFWKKKKQLKRCIIEEVTHLIYVYCTHHCIACVPSQPRRYKCTAELQA